MTTIDWLVLGAFFVLLIMVVVYVVYTKQETHTDYFLAGRNAGWVVIGASIFASNIGSEHLVGLAGAGAESGMAMAHWEMHGWLILVLGWVFVPFYARSKVFTMPEFLELRYNTAARSFMSIISLVSYILTKVAVTVYAGGIVFKEVFGIDTLMGIDFFWFGAIGLVLITGVFTVLGGMRAVLYTSVLQVPVLLLGSVVILVVGLRQLGGWDEFMSIMGGVTTAYGDPMTSLMRSSQDSDFPWTGVILGSAIIGFWYWCTDQYIVQRVLSGQNQKQARRGAIFGAYLKLLPVFIFLVPGMIAFAMHQKGLLVLTSSDAAFSTLVTTILPVGLTGVVVGGLIAALMSSLASLFNSSAMLFTMDFYQKWRPKSTDQHLANVGRYATIVVIVLGVLWIPVMKGMGEVLYKYLQQVQSLLAPGIAAVFLLGVTWKRNTPAAGLTGLIVGFVLGMTRLGLLVFENQISTDSIMYKIFLDHNWLHFCIYLFFTTIAVMVVVSMFTKPLPVAKLTGLVFGTASEEQKRETRESWDKWDVINSVIIIGIIVAFYIYFW